MMATSKVDIANQALSHIKVSSMISSLQEIAPEVDVINLHYGVCLDEVLAESNWGFAGQIEALALLPYTSGQWAYAYRRPSNAITVRNVLRNGESLQTSPDERIPYEELAGEEEGTRIIVTDQPAAWISFTKRVDNPAAYTPGFTTALGYRLAAAIAPTLAKSKAMAEDMMSTYVLALGRARMADKNARRRVQRPTPNAIRARTRSPRGVTSW